MDDFIQPEIETPALEERIVALAAKGMDEEEIRELLIEPLEAEPLDDDSFLEALERGRIRGRARIKAAQYEAALQGKVSAQTQVLERLYDDDPEQDGETREFNVVRRIIQPEGPEEPTEV